VKIFKDYKFRLKTNKEIEEHHKALSLNKERKEHNIKEM